MSGEAAAAARLLASLDLTNLDEGADAAAIEALCREAATGPIRPAAVCIWPEHIETARRALDAARGGGIAVAAVVNFPDGGSDPARALSETRRALAAGAGEIDLVFPWRAHLGGDREIGALMLAACKDACGARPLKAILETGEHRDPLLIRELCEAALAGGADFLKPSTGRSRVGATPEAARVLLEAIRDAGRGGFKAAGGIRTLVDARRYLALADETLGADWATPARFRIGASSLLSELRAATGGTATAGIG